MSNIWFNRTPLFWARIRGTIAFAVIFVAIAVLVSWQTRARILGALTADFGIMVVNTAVCLALLGVAVLLLNGAGAWRRHAVLALGAAAAALGALTLAEHMTGADLGIDLPEMHRWLQTREPAPGRMALGTSLAMLFLGFAVALWPYAARRRAGFAIQTLTVFAMIIASLGIIIREMQLQYLYSPYVFSAMALHTSIGIIAVSTGLWIGWRGAPWYQQLFPITDERRIATSGTAILLAIALSTGLFGFYAVQDTLEKTITDSFAQSLRARVRQFETIMEHDLMQLSAVSSRTDLREQLYLASRNPGDPAAASQLAEIADSMLRLGYAGVAIRDAGGREVARAGNLGSKPLIALPVQRRNQLAWNNGFQLHSEIDIFQGGEPVGRVITSHLQTQLNEILLDMKEFGVSADIELCGRSGKQASCFPTRLNSAPYLYPPPAQFRPHPIYRALGGESASEYGPDYRGTPVFAAFAPVADFGLGMVMKINSAELTAPLRREMERTLPVVLLLVTVGIALLSYLVHPLAQKLASRERQLKLALDNSGLAIWDWDTRSNKVYLSEQWQTLLGGAPAATTVTFDELRRLVHPDDAEGLANALRNTLKNGTPYAIDHRVKTRSGDWKWIRSTGNVVERDAHGYVLRMNGTNADITQRKQDEAALAHRAQHDGLTGMPNRSLFYDRLEGAMARARRDARLMAVMYLDIDKFKNINDTLGHAMGDELLKAFARRLSSCVRSVDTVARLGGDEFAVILEQLEERDAGRRIAEKIVVTMRPEFTLEYRTLAITTSVGIAFHEGRDNITPDSLVKKADQALYVAKGAGRNNYQVAD